MASPTPTTEPRGQEAITPLTEEVAGGPEDKNSVHVFEDGSYFRAMANRILVEFEPQPEMTAGGLHIPATARGDMMGRATVLCFGIIRTKRGAERSMGLNKGDRVLLLRPLAEQDANPWIQKSLGKLVAVVQLDDIIGVEE